MKIYWSSIVTIALAIILAVVVLDLWRRGLLSGTAQAAAAPPDPTPLVRAPSTIEEYMAMKYGVR